MGDFILVRRQIVVDPPHESGEMTAHFRTDAVEIFLCNIVVLPQPGLQIAVELGRPERRGHLARAAEKVLQHLVQPILCLRPSDGIGSALARRRINMRDPVFVPIDHDFSCIRVDLGGGPLRPHPRFRENDHCEEKECQYLYESNLHIHHPPLHTTHKGFTFGCWKPLPRYRAGA